MNQMTIIDEAVRLVSEGVCVTLPVGGRSMLPFIIGGQESVILQQAAMPKERDVVLAWVEQRRYVLHRIIRIKGQEVTLMGDGNLQGVEHCQLSDIRALATHVTDSHGKRHDLYSPLRTKAVRLWLWLLPIRRYLLAIYRICMLKNNK